MNARKLISIWFFIGVSLLVNGLLILSSGVYELIHPPTHPVVLAHLRAAVWWGAMLSVVGLFCCLYHVTAKEQQVAKEPRNKP
jgi:hypothetical protein